MNIMFFLIGRLRDYCEQMGTGNVWLNFRDYRVTFRDKGGWRLKKCDFRSEFLRFELIPVIRRYYFGGQIPMTWRWG